MTKVKRIHVKNVKAIVDQELNLNGATAILMAGNNKGKSTLLRTLKDRLLKLKADKLVRSGETNGLYEMEFLNGDKIRWELDTKTKAGEKLTLISNDGSKTSVITEIIKWFEPNNFDIDKFLNESPAGQRKSLEKLLGLDFYELDQRYAIALGERKDANRDVERILLKCDGKTIDDSLPANPINTDELEKEILGVEAHNDRYKWKVEEEERLIERRTLLEKELADINRQLDAIDKIMSDPTFAPKSTEYVQALRDKIDQDRAYNMRIHLNNGVREALAELTTLKDIAHSKDMTVKDILEEKDRLIKEAKMPEGFGFNEDGIVYNGLPISREQLSSSAIYIAALKLASLNVGRVRMLHFDASMLDNNSLKEVLSWADSQDIQLGIEMVSRDSSDITYELVEDWFNS